MVMESFVNFPISLNIILLSIMMQILPIMSIISVILIVLGWLIMEVLVNHVIEIHAEFAMAIILYVILGVIMV